MSKLLIIGGVAGGASCAARARRLSENAEIIIFERGQYVSFANCGLPYYVGNVITKENDLIVASPSMFKGWFNIEVRTESNVLSIDKEKKQIEVYDLKTKKTYKENYDHLLLSPGAAPFKPNIEGIDLPGIFTVRNIPDTKKIIEWIKNKKSKRAVIVGGGFIGLEITENLKRLGLDVSIIEMQKQVMPVIDPEMASFIHFYLTNNSVSLLFNKKVIGFRKGKYNDISVLIEGENDIAADIVILAIGVRPESELAKLAGLKTSKTGGIIVNENMKTEDDSIWAVGDAVEVKDFITGMPMLLPLAGPANRQARIAAEAIFGNKSLPEFRGVQGTAVCGIMGFTVAFTGLTEKILKKINDIQYEKIYLHPDNHAAYYPGSKTISMKLIFSKKDGSILGCQAIGFEGVEKRVDVISMAIQKKATVFDLEEAELCYAPQYGSAKDPVNIAGMMAANVLKGYADIAHWENIILTKSYVIDVRTQMEYSKGHFENAVNIPLHQLRQRLSELPKNKEIYTYCHIGKRSYLAQRILTQNGFKAYSISGGYLTYQAVKDSLETKDVVESNSF